MPSKSLQQGVEQQLEGPQRLAAVLGAETDENDPSVSDLEIDHGRASFEELAALEAQMAEDGDGVMDDPSAAAESCGL